MRDNESIAMLAEALIGELIEAGCTVSTAESCTGGWIAKSLTDIAGSSAAFGFGFVTYSNAAKTTLLGVSTETLDLHGAVSEPVVAGMAEAALERSQADFAVAVSGIAGPDGGSEEKPVGTVWFAWAHRSGDEPVVTTERRHLEGDRGRIRSQTVVLALQGLREHLRKRG